jgi:hypothetical protein
LSSKMGKKGKEDQACNYCCSYAQHRIKIPCFSLP